MGSWHSCSSTSASGCVHVGTTATKEANTQEAAKHKAAASPYTGQPKIGASLIERKEWLSSVVRGEEEQAKFGDRLRALDLLNQMEAIYIQRSEHRQATIVKLVIEEEDPTTVIEGEISTPDPS